MALLGPISIITWKSSFLNLHLAVFILLNMTVSVKLKTVTTFIPKVLKNYIDARLMGYSSIVEEQQYMISEY